jgi:hypothetical protein
MDPTLFSDMNFMPHGHCYLWRPDILWLQVVSDALVFLAYMIIPITLLLVLRKSPGLPYKWIFVMFSLFIFMCGLTHLFSIITVWHPYYLIEGLIKALTATISISTSILFIPLAPRVFKYMSNKVDHEKHQETAPPDDTH